MAIDAVKIMEYIAGVMADHIETAQEEAGDNELDARDIAVLAINALGDMGAALLVVTERFGLMVLTTDDDLRALIHRAIAIQMRSN
jgi:hypothetical protein